MRDIKYRAWDNERKIMCICTAVYSGNICAGYKEDETTDSLILDCELMQYTGLKDKNGVEIYEGDIVSIMDCEPSLYKIIWVDDMFRFDVEYIGTDLTNWQDESMGEFSSEDFTVIGNIYENSDLL